MQKFKRIGISGGTFDPIHHGHLIIAEHVRQVFSLQKVLFIPAGMPPHKAGRAVTPAEHRYNMVSSAASDNPHFEVSRIEIERPGYTYTIDTLTGLRQLYGSDTEIFFITGADAAADLLKWKEPQRLFQLCSFIAVFRPGYEKDKFVEQIERLRALYPVRIYIAEAPMVEISSTEIRKRVSSNMSIKYLVPQKVEEYIYNNKLYCGEL